jgi:phage-related protein
MAVGEKPKLEVRFFRTKSGAEPVRDWLKSLGKDERTVVGADIQRVQWRWPISKPLVDGLGGGLYEVRSTISNVEHRVLFCIVGSFMILLHGFVKKSQRAPKEIALGRDRKKELEEE